MKSSSSPEKVWSPDGIPDTATLVDPPPCTESTASVSFNQIQQVLKRIQRMLVQNKIQLLLVQDKSDTTKSGKGYLWSSLFPSSFSVFQTHGGTSQCGKSSTKENCVWWFSGGTLERLIGPSNTGVSSSTSEIWFLGVCYKISPEDLSGYPVHNSNGLVDLVDDFSSRILLTYRKGFNAFGDSKLTSDVHWGGDAYIEASQMLVAQPYDQFYIHILDQFGDSEASAFSIHNLFQAGKVHGVAAGSWVRPYAMCRLWETLARLKREPVTLTRTIHHCQWLYILFLVMKLGTSLGILGRKPGASTYIVGVQDDKAFYLDPHENSRGVAELRNESLEADSTSYHRSVVRNLPLGMIHPSSAIGFYCCGQASKLAVESSGAPLFTMTESCSLLNGDIPNKGDHPASARG
ncbi:hypothetical protein MKW94_024961 [Papaver nudicaule]|uniref:Cysteine protease n=1 Tax=Papaver nudicaule TaxID=74823 RepID=A0AA41RVM8_PAPNU|nr:hypothetical protein [Papaver nudicaule]